MKKGSLRLFSGVLAVLSFQAGSAEDPEGPQGVTEETEIMMLETIGKREPDHLVPVDDGKPEDWQVRYMDELRTKLKLESPFFIRMRAITSFDQEYVVALEAESGKSKTLETAGNLVLRYSVSDKSIWYSMPERNDKGKREEVKVATKRVVFPNETAGRLKKVWDRMILAARAPEEPWGGFDGVSYEFESQAGKSKIWNPMSRKSPRLFVELGWSLIDYNEAKEEERAKAINDIEARIQALEKYLDAKAGKEKKTE